LSLEAELYDERRRKWRRSAFWRGFLTAAFLALLIAIISSLSAGPVGPYIARYSLSGTIFDDPERDRFLSEIAKNEDVRALIIRINSPGGTPMGSEALYESIRNVASQKPVVAVLGEVAASGGYIAAMATDHIVARGNSLTGSIGIILEYPDLSELIERLGISVETVRSSELKAEPSPFRKTNPAAREAEQEMIRDAYDWFRGLVAERRDLSGAALTNVASGRVFTGRLALENGLIDALGGEAEALVYLESVDPTLEGLAVESLEIERADEGLGQYLGLLAKVETSLSDIFRKTGPILYSDFR
jgi:protease-4